MSSGAKILDFDRIKTKKHHKCVFCDSCVNLQFFRKQILCYDCLQSVCRLFNDGNFEKELAHK